MISAPTQARDMLIEQQMDKATQIPLELAGVYLECLLFPVVLEYQPLQLPQVARSAEDTRQAALKTDATVEQIQRQYDERRARKERQCSPH